jgi:hypothetical protein
MTKQEFSLFASALRTYYPREKNLLPNEQAYNLWYYQLQDLDYRLVEFALNKWVASNKWSPAISDIRELTAELANKTVDAEDWSDAWDAVMKAIKCIGQYRPEDALKSIGETSEIGRKVVERLGFRELCLSDNIVADRARFAELYKALATRHNNDYILSDTMRENVKQLKENGTIPDSLLLGNKTQNNSNLLEKQ